MQYTLGLTDGDDDDDDDDDDGDDDNDDFHSGCQNVSLCHHKQSSPGIHTPG